MFALRSLSALALLALLPVARADDVPAPEIDPHRIINESYHFLKEREPEMTETEYAIYEKVIPMVSAQPDFALRLLEGMVAEEDCSAAFEFVLGNAYFEQKRYAEAEQRFRNAVEKYPTFVRAWDNLGILYFSQERYAEAVPCFTKAISLGRWEPRLLGLLAFCLAKSGNPTAAEAAYLQALAIDPNNGDWLEGLLNGLLESGQFSRAEAVLRQLVRVKPRDSSVWLLLARVLVQQKRPLDAIAELGAGAHLGLLNNNALVALADLYAGQAMSAEALEIYRAVAANDPALGSEHLIRFARALIASGDLDRAQQVLENLEPKVDQPHRASYLWAAAELAASRKDWTQARRRWQELLELDPMNGIALLNLGEIEEAAGELSRATISYDAATRIPEAAFRANLHLANLEIRAQRYSEALPFIEAALATHRTAELEEFHARIQGLVETK